MRKESHSFRLRPHRHSPSGWALLIVALLFVAGAWYLAPTRQEKNPYEESLAIEEDRDAFFREVQKSDGSWVENSGPPIWQDELLAKLPQKYPVAAQLVQDVLGYHIADNGQEKFVDVDLSEKKLRAWEGDHLSFEFDISSGKPGYETVQGEFRVWYKVKYKAYRGGSRRRRDYYYLPNVPFSLFFYRGYAIHGAYWHNKFGQENVSHGCINLRPEDAKLLWYWAPPLPPEGKNAVRPSRDNPGLRVVVHE